MRKHVPFGRAMEEEVYELPERTVSIEARLKGFQKRNQEMCHHHLPAGSDAELRVIPGVGFGVRGRDFSNASAAASLATSSSSNVDARPAPNSLWKKCIHIQAPLAKESNLLLVHTKEHLAKLQHFCSLSKDMNASFFPFYAQEERLLSHSSSEQQEEEEVRLYSLFWTILLFSPSFDTHY